MARGGNAPSVPSIPQVSVVIVTHDSAHDIEACLESHAHQKGVPSLDVVVVDNGSRDGTPALVRRRFPRVKVVEQENRGFGAGNNRGVREARGDVLVFVNPDTDPQPGFVAALTAAVAPGQAATAQVALKREPGILNTAGHRLHFTGYGLLRDYRRPLWPAGQPRAVQGVSGAAFAIAREDFLRLGGFDEDFFLYAEDTELSWRMQRAGVRVVLATGAVVLHDYEPGLTAAKLGRLETGRLLLLRKHLPWWLWLAYLPSLVLADLLAWVRALGFGVPGLAAKARAVRSGMRRPIRRYDLPRARPHTFTSRRIPFRELHSTWPVRILGALVNVLFLLNTLLWSAWPRTWSDAAAARAAGAGGA